MPPPPRSTLFPYTTLFRSVGEGGTVFVLPGTYAEAIVIGKGLTLQSVEGESGPVVVEPPGAPTTAVAITTGAPVVIRGLTVHATGVNGIRGAWGVDGSAERVTATALSRPFRALWLI